MPEPTTIASNVLDIDGLLSVMNDQLAFIRFWLNANALQFKNLLTKTGIFSSHQCARHLTIWTYLNNKGLTQQIRLGKIEWRHSR
jgi:hypothetical protein